MILIPDKPVIYSQELSAQDIQVKIKNIGLSAAFILCIAAIYVGYYLINGPLLDSISVEGRGWADTMASFIFAAIFIVGIYSTAFLLLVIGSFGTIIISLSFVAAQLNKSIKAEEHPMIKWALGMLTIKKILLVTTITLVVAVPVYSFLISTGERLADNLDKAVKAVDIETTESLLQKSWIINLHNQFNLSFAFSDAIKSGNVALVQLFIDEGVTIHGPRLVTAVEHGHMEIVDLLIESGALLHEVDIRSMAGAGHTELVIQMIEAGADVSTRNFFILGSDSPLIRAAANGHTDIVSLLLNANAERRLCESNQGKYRTGSELLNASDQVINQSFNRIDKPVKWRCQSLALIAAIKNNHVEIAELLIETGADVYSLTGRTYKETILDLAEELGNSEMIQLLESSLELPTAINVINAANNTDWERLLRITELGAGVNQSELSHKSSYGWTALMYAAHHGKDKVIAALLGAGADIQYKSPASETALSVAVMQGHEATARLLIEAGADLSSPDLLIHASAIGNSNLVDHLISSGAELIECASTAYNRAKKHKPANELFNKSGYLFTREITSSIREDLKQEQWRCYSPALVTAIRNDHVAIARSLIEAGADIYGGAREESTSALRIANSIKNKSMTDMLQSSMVLPLSSNVINAARNDEWERLSKVVTQGVDVNQINTNYWPDTYGWTALMFAANEGKLDIVKLLIDAGADIDYVSPMGATANSLAKANNHNDIIAVLSAGIEQ